MARPRVVDKERSERILKSAAALFSRLGYAATTTRELAEGAELERASLYYHISTKEELLYRICMASVEDSQRAIEMAKQEVEPLERLRTFLVGHLTASLENRDMNVTMLLEMRSLTGERRDEVLALRDRYEEEARAFVRAAQESGEVRSDLSPKFLATSLFNLLNWTVTWYQPDGELGIDELAHSFATVFLDGARTR